MVLAFGIGGDYYVAEPTAKAIVFEELVAFLQGLALVVVVDEPAATDKVAEEVVEVVAFESGIDIALVVLAGVVGVLPLLPPVLVVEFLRDVPAAHRRVQSVKEHARSLWLKGGAPPPLDAQTVTVGLCASLIRDAD